MSINIDQKIMDFLRKIINDSLRTDVSLMFAPFQIALACLHIASVVLKKSERIRQWFSELTVDMDKVHEIVKQILHLYEVWKAFDEKEIPQLLIRMPKPNSRPSSAAGDGTVGNQQMKQVSEHQQQQNMMGSAGVLNTSQMMQNQHHGLAVNPMMGHQRGVGQLHQSEYHRNMPEAHY